MITKPMLAARCTNVSKIKFPVLATPKIDGIRCLRINGRSVSRTFKDIPNKYIQQQMQRLPDGLDGELIVGKTFQETTSGVMSRDGEPDFEYWVFDFVTNLVQHPYRSDFEQAVPYARRAEKLNKCALPVWCTKLMPEKLHNIGCLNLYESEMLALGYEGIMIRQPDSPYKCGRSTEREGYLVKIKRFKDSEAVILGFEEQMENTNPPTVDELGHTKRSAHQEGMVGKNTLGKFIVKEIGDTPWKGQIFRIGTGVGLTKERRQRIWLKQDFYLGYTITYKYQEIGTKNLPRCPIFKAFRED